MKSPLLKRLLGFFDSTDWAVEFRDGTATVVKGKVTSRFTSDCAEVLAAEGIVNADIRGAQAGGYIRLEFSENIPPAIHQQFRNIWSMHDLE